jgi:RNA polymerase sigma factor (sigma-70 family)
MSKHSKVAKGCYPSLSGTVSLSRAVLSLYELGKTMSQSKLTAEFERVILPHLNSAYNLARWLLRSEQDAQDVVHDAFLRAHRYFASFDGSDGRAWLLGIVRNACFSLLKTTKRQHIAPNEELDLQTSAKTSPEGRMMLEEDLQALRDCIEALPPEYREVLVLRELEELSYKDIATAAALALGTVMSRLNRARIRLENCLTGKGKEAGR